MKRKLRKVCLIIFVLIYAGCVILAYIEYTKTPIVLFKTADKYFRNKDFYKAGDTYMAAIDAYKLKRSYNKPFDSEDLAFRAAIAYEKYVRSLDRTEDRWEETYYEVQNKIGYAYFIAQEFKLSGDAFIKGKNYNAAIDSYSYENDYENLAKTYVKKADEHLKKEEFEQATLAYENAIKYYQYYHSKQTLTTSFDNMIYAYKSIAKVHVMNGDNESAADVYMDIYQLHLHFLEDVNFSIGRKDSYEDEIRWNACEALVLAGDLYEKLEYFDKSEHAFEEASKLFEGISEDFKNLQNTKRAFSNAFNDEEFVKKLFEQ